MTDYDYDLLGRLTDVTYAVGTPDEATQSFEYDPAGNITATIDENVNRTEFTYDDMNRLTTITEADPDDAGPLDAPVTTFDYDERGNLIEVIDAQGNRTTSAYDSLDRVISTVQVNPAPGVPDSETAFTYDPVGNLIGVTDPNGHATAFAYDGRDRRITSTDPDGGVTSFRYDVDDNLIFLTDPNGNRTRFGYDPRNRLVREEDPLGAEILFKYDVADNLIQKTDRNGRLTDFEYDDIDRLTVETWRDPQHAVVNTIDYTYDEASNLLTVADGVSALAFTYDHRDRVLSVDNAGTLAGSGLPQVVLDYTYDGVGNVLSVSETIDGVPAGLTNYQYDALNRMMQVAQTEAAGAVPDSVADKRVDFAYNQVGQFDTIDRFSDLAGTQLVVGTTYQYDDLNRLTNLSHNNSGGGAVAFYEFEYDSASRITAITDVDGRTDYTYDDRDQLTGADRHTADTRGDESYTYDANGNRIDSHRHGNGYVTGPANRLLSDGTFDYEYDDEGNMIRKTNIATAEVRELEYDHRNRLTRVTDRVSDGGVITQQVEYTYGVLDRRIAKTVDADGDGPGSEVTTHFVNDRLNVLLDFGDADGSGAAAQPELAARYLFGPIIDQVLGQEDVQAAQTLWLLTDHLGTVRDIVNNAGIVLSHITYDTFSNVLAQTDPAASTRYLFTGREFDAETGLYYYRARYFDADIGRFISEDPIRIIGDLSNYYRYVRNAPTSHVDPLGLYTVQIGGSLTFSGFGMSITFEFGGVFDDDGNFTNIGTVGVGAGVGLPGLQINPIQATVTNADTIHSREGSGFQSGFSFNSPTGFGGSVEVVGGHGYQGLSVGVGGGTPGFSFNNVVTATGLGDPILNQENARRGREKVKRICDE